MQLVLDGKSLAVGVFAGAALVAGLGAVQNERGEAGRFKIEAAGSGTGSVTAHVLDTATGQVWSGNRADFFKAKLGASE